jgi:hypothetical protein
MSNWIKRGQPLSIELKLSPSLLKVMECSIGTFFYRDLQDSQEMD